MSEMKHEKKRNSGFLLTIPFFVVMGVLTVVSFIIPLRPTQSSMEKRELAQFPEFSLTALADGSYFDDITLWFSDTFPGREDWLMLSSSISSMHGYSDIAIEGDLTIAEEIPVSEEILQAPVTEPENQAEPETDVQITDESEETEPVETEPVETEPEGWGGVDVEGQEIAQTAVIQIGDTAFNYLGFSQVASDKYIQNLNDLAEAMKGTGVRVVDAPAPTAIGIMVEPEYLEQMKCSRQDEMLNYLHAGMSDDVIKVDTFAALIEHNDEYLFFRTDHHWTALGAYYSYRAVCEALGYTPAELDSFEAWELGDFEGSIYWKAKYPKKLRMDTVTAYIPQGDIECVNSSDGVNFSNIDLLRDVTSWNANTRYLTFISGGSAITKITNNSLPDGPNCVVVIDSFGNCFVPFLSQNYHNVYAIDYRKYRAMNIQTLCEKYEIDDIIVAPYMTATQSLQGNGFFQKVFGT